MHLLVTSCVSLALPLGVVALAAAQAVPPVEFASVTPNLLVEDLERSLDFYRDVLGFQIKETVPPQRPFVFVWLERGPVQLFLNDRGPALAELPALRDLPRGGTGLFFVVSGVDAFYEQVRQRATVIMPIKDQPYGMREFAITDPDGFVLTFAERR